MTVAVRALQALGEYWRRFIAWLVDLLIARVVDGSSGVRDPSGLLEQQGDACRLARSDILSTSMMVGEYFFETTTVTLIGPCAGRAVPYQR